MAIYSRQFAAGVMATAGPETVYTVPVGYIAVLRGIDTFLSSVGPAPVSFAVNANPPCIFPGGDPPIIADGATHWTGYQVLNAGDVLRMFANFAGESYIISGYLLQT